MFQSHTKQVFLEHQCATGGGVGPSVVGEYDVFLVGWMCSSSDRVSGGVVCLSTRKMEVRKCAPAPAGAKRWVCRCSESRSDILPK